MTVSSQTGEKMVPVLYLDIDGTVRHGKDELGYFVNVPEDVRVFDGVPTILQRYKELGWRIVGISNQGGIALGHMDKQDCAAAMNETNRQCGMVFDWINICPHHPNVKDPEMSVCWCRKPRIGMLVESALGLAQTTGETYPPHMAVFVGDMDSDRETAENANIEFIEASVWRGGAHLWGLTSGGA